MANTYPPDDFFSDNPAVLRSLVTKARHDARTADERRYEAEARHTEARGVLCQERDSWKAKAEEALNERDMKDKGWSAASQTILRLEGELAEKARALSEAQSKGAAYWQDEFSKAAADRHQMVERNSELRDEVEMLEANLRERDAYAGRIEEALLELEAVVTKLNRYRDRERHPEVTEALVKARTTLAARHQMSAPPEKRADGTVGEHQPGCPASRRYGPCTCGATYEAPATSAAHGWPADLAAVKSFRELDAERESHAMSAAPEPWLPIEQAPKDGTEILLTTWRGERDGFGETDFGHWGTFREGEHGEQVCWDWLSNYGRVEEPTHFMLTERPAQGDTHG